MRPKAIGPMWSLVSLAPQTGRAKRPGGRPACSVIAMTSARYESAFSRRLSPEFCTFITLENTRVQGRPGDRMHPGPPRKKHCASARDHRYRRRHSGLPCAVGYGLLRALLGELCLIATVAVMRPLEPHDSLTPSLSAPEPHDFIRPRRCRSPHGTDPSTTFRATSAAIARRPLCRGGTNATIRQIRISEKMNIFAGGG